VAMTSGQMVSLAEGALRRGGKRNATSGESETDNQNLVTWDAHEATTKGKASGDQTRGRCSLQKKNEAESLAASLVFLFLGSSLLGSLLLSRHAIASLLNTFSLEGRARARCAIAAQ